ncbi:MAG: 6-carboxytetrahydropterin synthase QueD [Candidatus Firestonebacteria bacterium]|nr:6-carboxytetrahydropterin synthase QueD [Candidatus Firestonebacteria bacterium]
MYNLKIKTSFSSAHNLRNYKGKCESLHGHNWKVSIEVSSALLNNIGLVIDFKELKSISNSVIEQLDHKYLNELPQFKEINPSSENIAQYIFNSLKEKLVNYKIKLDKVTVWETQNSSAAYYE